MISRIKMDKKNDENGENNNNEIEIENENENEIESGETYESWELEIRPNQMINNKSIYKKYNTFFVNCTKSKKNQKCVYFLYYTIDKLYSCRYIIINKALSICAHIFIMVIFEIYFFFDFIVRIENQKFIGKIDSYFRHLELVELNEIESELIHQLVDNQSYYRRKILDTLYINYLHSKENQKQILNQLFIRSCKMGGGLGIIFCVLLGLSLHKSYRNHIQWKIIFFENLLMFFFLGIFEYYFFINIIMKYEPVTNEEIQYKLTNGGFNYIERLAASSN